MRAVAGALGVALAERLTVLGVLDEGDLSVSGKGRAWFAELLGEELPSRPRRPWHGPAWTGRNAAPTSPGSPGGSCWATSPGRSGSSPCAPAASTGAHRAR